MSVGHFYDLCNRHKGRAVEIKTHDGCVHRGVITHVDNRNVYLQPLNRPSDFGGFGYGYYGGFARPGFGWGIALGAIGTLALIPWFFI